MAYWGIHFLLNPKNPSKLCNDFLSVGAFRSLRALILSSVMRSPSELIVIPTNWTSFCRKWDFEGDSIMLAAANRCRRISSLDRGVSMSSDGSNKSSRKKYQLVK